MVRGQSVARSPSSVVIGLAIALLLYFLTRSLITESTGYDNESVFADVYENWLPIFLVIGEVVALIAPAMRKA